jgi:predicted PurR-regulated permease PerM
MNSNNLTEEPNHPLAQRLNAGHYFLLFLLFLTFYFSYHIIAPYLNAILLAVILATVLSPIHRKIEKFLKGRNNLAAFISCAILTIIVVVPILFILIALIQQGQSSFENIKAWISAGNLEKLLEHPWIIKARSLMDRYLPTVNKFFPSLDPEKIGVKLEDMKIDQIILQISSSVGKGLFNQGSHLFGNVSALIGKFFLMIFSFFFIIRERDKLSASFLHLLPLSASHEQQIIIKIKSIARSALLGAFVTALAQGAAGGFAFWIADLPGFFWGSIMAFTSLIPIVGTALVWAPATVYLFLAGYTGYGIFLLVWSVVVVGMIDNFVRPIFMQGSGDSDMSAILIFFSILGGINYFGLIGILYGPLIFGITIVLLYIYELEFKPFLSYQDKM